MFAKMYAEYRDTPTQHPWEQVWDTFPAVVDSAYVTKRDYPLEPALKQYWDDWMDYNETQPHPLVVRAMYRYIARYQLTTLGELINQLTSAFDGDSYPKGVYGTALADFVLYLKLIEGKHLPSVVGVCLRGW